MSNVNEAKKGECQKNSETCKICHGKNCNSKNAFIRCIECDSESDSNCIELNGRASIKACQAYDDECFVFTRKNAVKRGCLQEMSYEFLFDCKATHMQTKCQTCKNANRNACNYHDLNDTCIECDSRDDLRCRDDPASMIHRICSVHSDKSTGCYLQNHGDTFKRGCLTDLDEADQNQCYKQSDKCKSCFGKNCNVIRNFRTCYVCNSRNDSHCAKVSESTDSSTCFHYPSSCVSGLENGYTYRNCTENIGTNEKIVENELEICSADKCNEIILPEQRLQCYQCSGNEECKDINSDLALGPCKFYSELDQCYTLVNDGKKF